MGNFTIKVTNHLTGEISEIEIKSADQAANALEELNASKKALDTAITKLKSFLDYELGDDDQGQFGNFLIQRVQRTTKTWTVEGMKSVGFDEDALAVISKIDMTAAKQLVDEALQRGEIQPDAKKILNESADIKNTTPYLTFKQVK